jgi:hypothetical protein
MIETKKETWNTGLLEVEFIILYCFFVSPFPNTAKAPDHVVHWLWSPYIRETCFIDTIKISTKNVSNNCNALCSCLSFFLAVYSGPCCLICSEIQSKRVCGQRPYLFSKEMGGFQDDWFHLCCSVQGESRTGSAINIAENKNGLVTCRITDAKQNHKKPRSWFTPQNWIKNISLPVFVCCKCDGECLSN